MKATGDTEDTEIGIKGTGAEVWLNLETAYQLFVTPDPDPAIKRRASAMKSVA